MEIRIWSFNTELRNNPKTSMTWFPHCARVDRCVRRQRWCHRVGTDRIVIRGEYGPKSRSLYLPDAPGPVLSGSAVHHSLTAPASLGAMILLEESSLSTGLDFANINITI